MTGKVVDITPEHIPVALIREFADENRLKDAKAAFVIWLDKDDELQFEFCGLQSKDVLWALKRMEQRLMGD